MAEQISGEAAIAVHMEREAREAAEERAADLKDALVEKNDRVIELERRCVNLRSELDQARNQERQRIQKVLMGEGVRREIADIAANNGDAEDIARLVRQFLADRLALDILDPSGEGIEIEDRELDPWEQDEARGIVKRLVEGLRQAAGPRSREPLNVLVAAENLHLAADLLDAQLRQYHPSGEQGEAKPISGQEKKRLEECAHLLQKHAQAGPNWGPVAFLRDFAGRQPAESYSYIEIDAAEFEEARKDPRVKRLLEQADAYGRSLGERDHSPPSATPATDTSKEERERWKVDDDYPCRARKPDGGEFVFDDLIHEGDEVGLGEIPEDCEDRDPRPPYGRVLRESDGLWIVVNTVGEERERTLRLLRASSKEVGGNG
jgi:protein-tyrosine-phosphatase